MRILFLTQLLPLPLDAGPKIRSFYNLRYLAEAGHDVTLASFVRPADKSADIATLKGLCRGVETVEISRSRLRDALFGMQSLLSRQPFLIVRDRVAEMDALLERLCGDRSFDAVHADQLWMAPYAERCEVGRRVLDQHNAVFMAVRRMADGDRNPLRRTMIRDEATKLESFERSTCKRFDSVVWVSEDDRRALAHSSNGNGSGGNGTNGNGSGATHRDCVIPIATDPQARGVLRGDRRFRVTFLGGMHWPPNAEGIRWFGESIWPQIAAAAPSAVLTVIGKGAPSELERLAAADRVEVTGYVDDVEPYLRETAVFIVPLLSGAGMRVKILDAWCGGLPIVSTAIGAEGIDARDGEDILLADAPAEFADAVVRVLQDLKLARRLGDAGRATVERAYDWREVYRAWDAIYS